MVNWESNPPRNSPIQIEYIDHFDARGNRRVYGRSDTFPSKGSFNLDIWCDRRGRLLARFWSRSMDVDGRSLEITGLSPQKIPERESNVAFQTAGVPRHCGETTKSGFLGSVKPSSKMLRR